MRITTNQILRSYSSGLAKATANMNLTRTHVMTQRSFNSAAENPAAAMKASQLWRKAIKNDDHLSMIKEVQELETLQESSLLQVSELAKKISKDYSLKALNGTNGEDSRESFAAALRGFQKSMTLSLNTTYGGTAVFAGANGDQIPFEIDDDGNVTYLGVNVNAAEGTEDYEKLKKYASEHKYLDLGFGLQFDDDGKVVSSSAYDASFPGISITGYGMDEKGYSNNIIALTGQMADELENPDFNADRYEELCAKFQELANNVLDSETQLGVKSEFLTSTEERLSDNDLSLQEQIMNVEGIDMAAAITEFSWASYAYNAALKVGTSILSSSFIDFMR